MNERAPQFIGRDDLETLMASANSDDWVKITFVSDVSNDDNDDDDDDDNNDDDDDVIYPWNNTVTALYFREMLLGPRPDNFVFVPKHKANSFANEQQQG